jgi:hypothetical protein
LRPPSLLFRHKKRKTTTAAAAPLIAITPAATAAATKKEDLSGCFSVNIINSNICVFLHTVLRGDYDLDFSPLLHILPAEEEEEEAFRFFKTIQPSAIAATTAATITR